METRRVSSRNLAALPLLVLGATAAIENSADAAATVISKSEQKAVVTEARVQRNKLIEAQRRWQSSDFDDAYQSELAGYGYRWTRLDASKVAKSAFMSCSAALADITSLMVNRSYSENWQDYDAKKRRYLADDTAQCDAALRNPETAFLAP